MPPVELAARILPWFSSQRPSGVVRRGARPKRDGQDVHALEEVAYKSIAAWLKTGSDLVAGITEHDERPFKDPDFRAVAEAIQALEHASLLMKASGNVGLTRLGMHALRTNTVRQHLGLGDAPPSQP